jgi:hypothetical protein
MKVGTGIVAMLELLEDFFLAITANWHITDVAVDPPRQEVRMVVAFKYHLEVDMRMLLLEALQIVGC